MSLSAGTRLGPYEILAPLGAGGMGEVYRARDRKLDRDVAVKVLPQATAADPDTLARFEREAKAVAALSHPNILSIFDFGDQDGVAYAVMELLDGETLRAKLDAGAITQKQAVDYTLQIAKGLAAAHEKGVVHRDLKPENLFISRDGHLKILDFGLAKRVDAVAPGMETSAPTGSGHTEPGTVMGTAGYMSPEQVKGFPVDHRSDIFSLGAILYELLSGNKAFKRPTNAETMAAILRDDPPELSESGRNISPAVDRVVKHCLEKDRDHRFQSARDIAFSLSDPSSPAAASAPPKIAPPIPAGFSVAVKPFKCGTADADVLALADGLSEEIVRGLSRFRYLSVVASPSAAHRKGEGDDRAPGTGPGARYVVEGSIRRGGPDFRVSAQLVDSRTGAQLWSETYRRDLQTLGMFALQDDVAARVVATVADSYGVLVHAIRAASRQKDDADLTPVEWQFQYFAYREQITPSAYAALKSRLERAAERNDRQSDLWACLAQVYVDEYAFGFGSDAASMDRALAAARRAVELDRANQFAMVALAQVHFFRRDLAAFGPAAERAMALNPLNTDAVGILGLQIVHTGEFERGAAIVRRAMELNPNHAGWMHFAPLWEHFHKGEYEQALECANRVDVPGLFWPFLVVASACGHLGRHAEAESAVRDLLALDPDFGAHARSNVGTWHFASGLMEPILEGLRKAGLSIPAAGGSSDSPRQVGTVPAKADRAASGTASGRARAEEGFWVAVLTFKYGGADTSLKTLAEGLTEEIVTGLSRFSYLKVISRGSAPDAQSAGKELGARYIMEGSLRQAGAKLRLAVQLVDAVSGAHLWAENYERSFSPEAVFELQDELVPRIVSTVADMHGVLPRSMSEVVRLKSADQMSPYEALLRSFGYNERFTPEDLAEVRTCLERAVQQSPGNAECWAMLSLMYANEYGHWDNAAPDSLDRSLRAARTAVEAAPLHSLPYYALAQALFFKREIPAFRVAAERAISLNPMDGATAAFMGLLIAYAGDWERGCALSEKGSQLNPNHPGWYRYTAWHDAYRKKDYRKALDVALRLNAPQNYYTHAVLAMCYAQLGQMGEARSALRDMLALKPNYAEVARELHGRWIDPDLVEQLMDGLRKAGLEIATAGASGPAGALAHSSAADSGATRADEGFWVAVLPFKSSGADASLTALAEGLTEEIVTGLSRFSYLKVIARSATAGGRSGDELGARYVMEGSLRHAGTRLRVAVQLVDALSGAHLWAENYERPFSSEAVFELQDELVPRIVSTVADMHGVLSRSMSETLRSRTPEQLSPYEAVLRGFGYFERATAEELAAARSGLESAVRKAPAYADAWAMLSILSTHEYGQAFDLQAGSLTSGVTAARRAVEAASSNHLAWFSLAQALFFQKEFQSFRNAAERAVALNPMDGDSIATLGGMLTCAGDLERGLALTGRAKQLNPHHPGWYWWVDFCNAYRQGDYRGALNFALKMNLPGHWFMHAAVSAAHGQLGERAAASRALQDLLKIRPDFAATVRVNIEKWWKSDFVEHLMDGWRKAGLEIPDDPAKPAASLATISSGAVRADEGFWVAVLPFQYAGGSADLRALGQGLTDDIVTGLSRFSYLRVIARSSTPRLADSAGDVRSVGKELGARYVMEGTLRQAGGKLRLAVQLVDAVSGAHLWAENYERIFSPEAVFELQDDLAPRIVSMVAGMNGVLPRSMSEAVRSRAPEQLSPYEAVLRSFGYLERVTPEELSVARAGLESAVGKAPDYADAWAMLALLCLQDYGQGFNLQPDSLARGSAAARRAVEVAPSSPLALFSLAQALFFQKEFESFRNVAERAAALNPMDGNSIAFIGELLTYAGDSERGLALAGRAKKLNPNHPGWYWYADYYNAYRQGDDRGAHDVARKINLSGHWGAHVATAAACGQLGQRDAAGKALRELLKLRPNFATTARSDFEKWWEPEYVDRLIDGLRKAGLEVSEQREPVPLEPTRPSESISGAAHTDEGFWVAVLPFQHSGGDAGLAALAEGMTDEIVTGLSRFSYLRVISRTSTRRYSSGAADVRSVGRELGARYVLDGSLRHAGPTIRISVQLIDAVSGANLWAETYNRSYQPEAIFDVQDDVVRRIVSTVADTYGVLPHSMSEALRGKNPDVLTPYEAVIRGLAQLISVSADEHASVRAGLERAVQEAPGNADCWALLSNLCREEYAHGFNPKPDPLGRALAAARRAVEIAPSNHLAYHALATALFLRREFSAFRSAAERAIALNPMDGFTMAYLGSLVAYSGDWERGCAMAKQARELNPHHPSWYWFSDCFNAYRQGDDRGALDIARKIQMPGFWRANLALAATYGQLGERESAARALRELLTLRPTFANEGRAELQKWWNPDLVERLMDGLRKAGLGLDPATASAPPSKAAAQVSIAALPFSDMSAAKDQEYLCEGMAEEIMNALVRIPGIRVASRTSAFRARRDGADLAGIARALSVGHVLEGSVRTAGSRLRVTAQLTDVASGYQLWSERFDREAADIFAVQDEIAAGVVEAVKARLAPGEHAVRPRPQPASLEAYRSYLMGRHLRGKEHHVEALHAFEEAVRLDPSHAPSWTGLAETTVLASVFGLIPAREACATARTALATAARLQGESAEGLHVEAFAAWIERRWAVMETAWRRAIALEPNHVLALASFGIVLCTRQRLDEALPFFERARQADPLASFPYTLTGGGLLNCGRLEEALRYLDDALSFEKEDATALDNSGMALVALDRFEEGIARLEHVVAVSHRAPHFLGTLGWALATSGRKDEARTILEELRARPAGSPAVVSEAWLLAALGEVDAAFGVIARAEEECQAYLYFTGVPAFDPLRGDPRFGALLERLELPREQSPGAS